MSAADYLARSVQYDIEEEARADWLEASDNPDPLPSPEELGCTYVGSCGAHRCYCWRLARRAGR